MSVPVAKFPVISPIPGNCRTLASVTAIQPFQVQPWTVKPSLVSNPAGFVAIEPIAGVGAISWAGVAGGDAAVGGVALTGAAEVETITGVGTISWAVVAGGGALVDAVAGMLCFGCGAQALKPMARAMPINSQLSDAGQSPLSLECDLSDGDLLIGTLLL